MPPPPSHATNQMTRPTEWRGCCRSSNLFPGSSGFDPFLAITSASKVKHGFNARSNSLIQVPPSAHQRHSKSWIRNCIASCNSCLCQFTVRFSFTVIYWLWCEQGHCNTWETFGCKCWLWRCGCPTGKVEWIRLFRCSLQTWRSQTMDTTTFHWEPGKHVAECWLLQEQACHKKRDNKSCQWIVSSLSEKQHDISLDLCQQRREHQGPQWRVSWSEHHRLNWSSWFDAHGDEKTHSSREKH